MLKSKYSLYCLLNVFLVAVFSFIILYLAGGLGHSFPVRYFGWAILIAIPIICAQYPILNLKKSWLYKSFVFYVAMVLFMIVFSMTILYLKDGLGDDGILSLINAGIGLSIIGQLYSIVIGFIPVLAVNYFFRKKLFK